LDKRGELNNKASTIYYRMKFRLVFYYFCYIEVSR